MKWLLGLIGVILMFPSVLAYPKIEYLSIKDKTPYEDAINSIPEQHFEGINKIQIYGIYRWGNAGGWFTTNRVIMIDKHSQDAGLGFKSILEHELTHNKCYSKQYGWDLSHTSKCFKEGLI